MKPSNPILGAILSLLLCGVAWAQAEVRYTELPNYHQVNMQLYRGGQPKAGGLAQLARSGVKTIINLRGADERAQAEAQAAHALGLNYYNVPLPDLHRPDDTSVQRVLGLLADPQLQPVFVHCKRGADRTGTIIACYRMQHDHWPPQAALAEAKHYGMSWLQRGMKNYVKEFARHNDARAMLAVKMLGRTAQHRFTGSACELSLKGVPVNHVSPGHPRPF